MPESIEFVNAGTLGNNVSGAYAAEDGSRILLDASLLNDPAKLERVFVEELGHHFDAALGGVDSAGDEGAIFAESFQKGPLNQQRLQTLRNENDAGVLKINGRNVEVEHFYGGTPAPSPTPSPSPTLTPSPTNSPGHPSNRPTSPIPSTSPTPTPTTTQNPTDPAFLPSWNKQVLRLLKDQPDTEGEINRMEEISMSVDEGYAVLMGFLGDYEKTLMSDESMLTLMASLKNEQDMPVQARPEGGYWEHWTRCLSTVVDSNQSSS